MRYSVILFCLLLVSALAAPAIAAEVGVMETPTIIKGVTMEPTNEPTEKPVTAPTTQKGPEVGWLTIASTPSGAHVTLDGNSRGVTPLAGIEVGAGSHSVGVTMSGYEPYETSVSVSAGEQAAVDATLTPVTTPVPTTKPTAAPQPIGGDKGWITVHCNVNGATVSFDDLSAGCTITNGECSREVTVTGTPYKTFTVQKPGYYTFTGPVSPWPGKGETVDLYATLSPVPTPTYGSIRVTSSPSGAVAYLDGLTWQYTPCTFSALSAGTNHQVQISMPGYQTYTTTATVPSDGTAYVNANLVPNYPQSGSLNVVTTPKGADIYVDGRFMAESPSVIPGLAPGSHSVRLHKSGYDEYVSTFTIYAGQQTPLTVTLTPQSGSVGAIEVASTPGGSSLYLDTHYMGLTPSGGYLDLTSIAPGSHTILLRHTDYQDYSQSVYVPAGGVATVNAKLTPIVPGPTPDATGQIVIASSPPGAEALLDNVYKGVTPLTLTDISAGSHVLTLRLTGYQDYVQTVTVTGGQSAPVAATLVAAAPTQAKSPATVLPALCAIIILGAVLVMRRG
ncbi:MAG: PEGA domain protein [Methanoregula sp. PtaU1.Bin051]|nr:MAG: PEGA domain protein [Methanoregula sp. PtaU1.Bin051]